MFLISAARRPCCRTLPAITLLFTAFFIYPKVGWADTDHIRELAKNKPRTLIVASGPDALPLAQMMEQAIRRRDEWRKRKPEEARVVLRPEADTLLKGRDYARASVVLLLSGRDFAAPEAIAPLPPSLLALLPFEPGTLQSRRSVVQSVLDVKRAGDPLFRIALYAPDAPRLRRLYDELLTRRVGNFRELPFASRYQTNRVALFSAPSLRPLLQNWGQQTGAGWWNDVRWYPLEERAKLTREQLAECSEVYFVDRSQADTPPLPEAASLLLSSRTLGPTTVLVARSSDDAEDKVAVVSTPSRLLLATRLARRPHLAELLKEPVTKDVLDLSRIGATNLLIVGGGTNANPETVGSLHAQLSRQMRERLNISVAPRDTVLTQLEAELAYQMARGATETRGLLQRKYPSRFAWVFALTSITGGTTYQPSERKLTASLPAFTRSEPSRPVRKKNEDETDWRKRWRRYSDKKDEYKQASRDWWERYRNDPCEWERSVSWESAADVRGLLQLVDTKTPSGAQIVWEQECGFAVRDKGWLRTERATVRGHDNKPGSLEVPPASSQVAQTLLLRAAVSAGNQGVNTLCEEALLPEPSAASLQVADMPLLPALTPAKNLPLPGPKIAEVSGKMVTLNIGTRQGVRVGDRYEVLLKVKETLDPDTGRVLRTKVLDSFFLTITYAEEEVSDCMPATPRDAARLKQAKVGTRVRLVPAEPSTAPRVATP